MNNISDAKINCLLFGTSNAIISPGYFKLLEKNSVINLIASFRVGDVPSSYFISSEKSLYNIANVYRVDTLIIDSMINDVLMTESGVIGIEYLALSFNQISEMFKIVFGDDVHIILLNICPKAVENAKQFNKVKEIRYNILSDHGFDVHEVDILNSDNDKFFPKSDPLHINGNYAQDVVGRINKCISRECKIRGKRNDTNTLQLHHYVDLCTVLGFHSKDLCYFKSSLATEAAILLQANKTLKINFDENTKLLGLKFVDSQSDASYISVTTDAYSYFIPTASRYPKPLIRFCPFPISAATKPVRYVEIALVHRDNILNEATILKLPNQSENSGHNRLASVKLFGIVSSKTSVQAKFIPNRSCYRRPIRVCFECFWPGFIPKNDPIFGVFLSKHYDIHYTEDVTSADIVFVSWYSPDKNRMDKYRAIKELAPGKVVYYTAEHDGDGLQGENQLNFNIFDHVFSHYYSSNKRHTWMPNYIRRYGIDVFSSVNQLFANNIHKSKLYNIQFCYSNASCEFRNWLYESLNARVGVDAHGSLYNETGTYLPREYGAFIDALSNYKFVIACENNSFPGYNTEKIVHAFMAGAIPIYWGDPLISTIWNEECFINLHNVKAEFVIDEMASNIVGLFERYKNNNSLPFPNAGDFSDELKSNYLEVFNDLFYN